MFRLCFHNVTGNKIFGYCPGFKSEIFCLRAVFVACSLFSCKCTYSEFRNTYKQATRAALIWIISLGRQGLEQRKVLKERVFMMFSFFGETNGFSFQNLAAFEVIGTKAKSNSDDVFGHGTALLKISGNVHICGVFVTNSQCLFNSHWSAVSACRSSLRRVTAVAHGCLFMHLSTMWVKGSGIVTVSSFGGVKSERKHTRLHT